MEETTWNKLHLQSSENFYVSHHLQGVGAYCVSCTTVRTACYYCLHQTVFVFCKLY